MARQMTTYHMVSETIKDKTKVFPGVRQYG